MVRPKKIGEFRNKLANTAQTSHYQVFFDGLSRNLFNYLASKGVDRRFIIDNAGLLCNSASIPGSTLGTSDIFGNFTGVQEKFAHTRIFTELVLSFYVDSDFKLIKLSSTPAQYGNSDTLQVNCTFNYERYVAGKDFSLNVQRGDNENFRLF